MQRWMTGLLCAVAWWVPGLATAQDIEIRVAPKGSPAEAAAQKAADGKSVFAERRLFKAFEQAAEHLTACKTCTVTLKLAAGQHTGKGGTGQWSFPEVVAPGATLRILGGWDDTFSKRAPFDTQTVLVTSRPRSGAVLSFEGKKHALKELYVSGLVIDVSPGNNYDKRTNSLLKGTSASWPLLAFGYLTTDRLVIADNVFMNGAHGVGAPLIRPASTNSEVIVRNNLFLNNVFTWQVKGSAGKHPLKRYAVVGNSFILNWPYNPDAGTSNPGTLEIGNKSTAALVEVAGNLFAYNVGGAIFPQWDDKAGPRMAIQRNLFWGNGSLFQTKSPGEGAVVGKFNRSAVYRAYDPEVIEEDFSWDTGGNVVKDPRLAIPVLKVKALGQEPKAPAKPAPAPDADDPAAFFGVPSEDFQVDEEVEASDFAEEGSIKNYAPHMPYNPDALPFPKADEARGHGASAERVVQP